jgi:queuine tRNA-ribosyltransferase
MYGYDQTLFPIVQGGTYADLRKESCAYIGSRDTAGCAIGGLSVGEPPEMMYEFCALSCEHLPWEKTPVPYGRRNPMGPA